MVIIVYVEGGTIDGNVDANTMQNSEALREELNRFMQRALDRDDISIIVKKCAGFKMAVKEFIRSSETNIESYLYVDLDRNPELKSEWFRVLNEDGIIVSTDKVDHIYFWIQEMESWFLKQPQAIEDWAIDEGIKHRKGKPEPISEHQLIKGKDIEHLQQKASDILNVIFRQIFEPTDKTRVSKSGKVRHLKYGKLRHAPGIIAHLDSRKLMLCDNELMTFVNNVVPQ